MNRRADSAHCGNRDWRLESRIFGVTMTTTLGWRYIVLFFFSPSIIFDVSQEKNEKNNKKKDGFAYRNVKET
jgi:hypothetical protein